MSIFDKIEKIRRQPEHVRLRWAWGLTAGSIILVLILWAILLKSQTDNFSQGLTPGNDFSQQFDQQKKSIKDAAQQLKGTVDAGKEMQQKAANQNTGTAGSNAAVSNEGFNPSSSSDTTVNPDSSSN